MRRLHFSALRRVGKLEGSPSWRRLFSVTGIIVCMSGLCKSPYGFLLLVLGQVRVHVAYPLP